MRAYAGRSIERIVEIMKQPKITPELREKMRQHEIERAKELGLDHKKMTRMITDPEEVEAQRLKHIGRLNWEAAMPLFPIRMSIRARAKMNGSPRSHMATLVSWYYLDWLRNRQPLTGERLVATLYHWARQDRMAAHPPLHKLR